MDNINKAQQPVPSITISPASPPTTTAPTTTTTTYYPTHFARVALNLKNILDEKTKQIEEELKHIGEVNQPQPQMLVYQG